MSCVCYVLDPQKYLISIVMTFFGGWISIYLYVLSDQKIMVYNSFLFPFIQHDTCLHS